MKAKWGVLGAGGIARRRTIPEGIVPADNAVLSCVMTAEPEITQAVADEFDCRVCDSEEELLQSDCDIVYIATPVHLHCLEAVRAAEAGKHVLCEKPLGLDVNEAERVVNACARKDVKLGIGLMMRFHAQHQAALRLVQDGSLGKPVFGRAQLSCWYPPMDGAWRQEPQTGGGGSLMDMGSHCIDLLEMFFGPVKRVSCMTQRLVHSYESEDSAVVLLEFQNGAQGVVDTFFNMPDASSKNRLELYGTQGSILAEGTIGQGELGVMAAHLEGEAKGYEAQQERAIDGGMAITPEPVNMYRAEVEAFSAAVLGDTPPPVSGGDGLRSQCILAACYESAATGRAVEV